MVTAAKRNSLEIKSPAFYAEIANGEYEE